jgi:hypothetical protein
VTEVRWPLLGPHGKGAAFPTGRWSFSAVQGLGYPPAAPVLELRIARGCIRTMPSPFIRAVRSEHPTTTHRQELIILRRGDPT